MAMKYRNEENLEEFQRIPAAKAEQPATERAVQQ